MDGKPRFKNRIVGHGEKPAAEFRFNPLNWRRHPESQEAALREILSSVGWVTGVIENARTGNLIDGHGRIEAALKIEPQTLIPFTRVDLSEDEERKILALFDPIGGLAVADEDKLWELLESISFEDQSLNSLVENLREPMRLPEIKEYTEEIESEVEFIECPKCQHRFPK
jgi:hypothetical protein